MANGAINTQRYNGTTTRVVGTVTAHGFACGYVERSRGVVVERSHGVYHVKRHPDAAGGHAWVSATRLRDARRVAAMLRRGVDKATARALLARVGGAS